MDTPGKETYKAQQPESFLVPVCDFVNSSDPDLSGSDELLSIV